MEKCSVAQILPQDVNEANRIKECIVDNKLLLANGTSVNIIVNVCQQKSTENTMPVLLGRVGKRQVTVLRDTGCSGAVVKAQFVEKEQYLGKDGYMMMMDKTIRKAPLARIMVDTPFYKGDIQALCLPDSIYDLIIGNIPLARPADKPDPMWTVASCKAQKEDNKKEDKKKEDIKKNITCSR